MGRDEREGEEEEGKGHGNGRGGELKEDRRRVDRIREGYKGIKKRRNINGKEKWIQESERKRGKGKYENKKWKR